MKKLIFVLVTLLTLSCSKSDDKTSTSNDFNPPSWIQGTWGIRDNDLNTTTKLFRFTNDDYIIIASPFEQSYKGLISQIRSTGGTASVTESISPTNYSFTANITTSTAISNSFTYIIANSIKWNDQNATLIRLP